MEKAFHEFILPPCTDDKKRTDRLLYVLDSFADNDRTRKAFLSVIERQAL